MYTSIRNTFIAFPMYIGFSRTRADTEGSNDCSLDRLCSRSTDSLSLMSFKTTTSLSCRLCAHGSFELFARRSSVNSLRSVCFCAQYVLLVPVSSRVCRRLSRTVQNHGRAVSTRLSIHVRSFSSCFPFVLLRVAVAQVSTQFQVAQHQL